MIYRPYQIKAYNAVIEALRKVNRVILRLPTGAGKSHIALRLVSQTLKSGKRVCFVCERISLVDQIASHAENLGIHYSVIRSSDGRFEWNCDFQIASAQTIERRKIWDQGLGFDLIIIDECHLMREIHRDMLCNYKCKFLGLSATPWRKGLGLYWDKLIDIIDEKELIYQGYLSQWEAYGPPKGMIDTLNLKTTKGDYDDEETFKRVNRKEIYANIIETWSRLSKGRNTLVFAANIEHSKKIRDRFLSIAQPAFHVDAYTDGDKFREIISDYKRVKGSILCSVSKLSTGFDLPEAETAIIARPTKSHMTHYQMLGRLMRTHPGKDKALFIDHSGNIERLGTPDSPPKFTLDYTDADVKRHERKKIDVYCKSCGKLKKSLKCPYCGHESKPYHFVSERGGELEKMYRSKLEFMCMLKYYEIKKGYKNGWSIHMYRHKFKEEPLVKFPRVTKEPDEDVMLFIKNRLKYERIRYANRRS